MKEIGIFGDSYAAVFMNGEGIHKHGWSVRLRDDNPGNVDIYAKAATSLEWSFNNFLKYHAGYKRNIFIVTSLNRLTTIDGDVWAIHDGKLRNNGVETKLAGDPRMKAISDTIMFLYNNDTHNEIELRKQEAIITHIKTIRPDTIVIPGFWSPSCYVNGEYNWSLYAIDSNEHANMFDSSQRPQMLTQETDYRTNHLHASSNNWVYEHIKARLRGEFIDWNPTLTKQFSNKDFYLPDDII